MDVNITPDKRQVMLHEEAKMLLLVKVRMSRCILKYAIISSHVKREKLFFVVLFLFCLFVFCFVLFVVVVVVFVFVVLQDKISALDIHLHFFFSFFFFFFF